MQHFLTTLTPEQLALIAGVFAPIVQHAFDRWRKFSSGHNYILSFLLPLLGTVAVFLSQNAAFNELVPVYATVYATGQIVYVTAVRYWKAYSELSKLKAAAPEASF